MLQYLEFMKVRSPLVKLENRYFESTPKVVPADQETVITIRPLFDHCRFSDEKQYEVSYFPCEEFARRSGWPDQRSRTLKPIDGILQVPQYFESEQEHVLIVEEISGDQRKMVGDFRVYSAREDLFCRRPYKGDMHIHSSYSDGRESPGYVASACRRIGFDFMALTDHGRYAPSVESQRVFEGVDLDLRIFRGEEVHPPSNPVHMINFGGSFSVNDLFSDSDAYYTEVKKIEDALGELPPGVDRYQYASCCFCFDKIREGGGLGIFCHPYWFTSHRYSPSGAITSHLFEQQPFDAYELIGGYHRSEVDSNTLQVARYHEERACGREIPIVGVSDAHGCERGELFGWYYTILFAPTSDLPDLIAGVKDLYSVAVEALPGETPRAYGPFRFVKYALFLMREVMPQHDELCAEEGRRMLQHLAGDASAAHALATLSGRTDALLERYYGADT